MCVAIAELRESMGRYAAGFDPALVSATDAAMVVDHAAAIEKTAATIKALAAARVADTDLWRRDGDRSAAHHLARTTGTTVGAAADALAVGRRLDQLPDTAAAARRGELSPSQVSAIADAAGADPSAEARLVDAARHSSLQELKDDCARTKAAASADAEARRQRIHDSRYLRAYTGADGAWNMHVRNNTEVGAEIMAVINPICDRIFAKARAERRREPHEAYTADALTALARTAGTATAADARPAATATAADARPAGTATANTGPATADRPTVRPSDQPAPTWPRVTPRPHPLLPPKRPDDGPNDRPGPPATTPALEPTQPDPWPGEQLRPRSSCGSTWGRCCGAIPSPVSWPNWWDTGRWRYRSSAT